MKLLIQHERCIFYGSRFRGVDTMICAATQKLPRFLLFILGRIILIKFQMLPVTYCCPEEPHLRQSGSLLFHRKGS